MKISQFMTALVMSAAILIPVAASGAPTFSKDVSPILQAKCQSCHEPGSIGPMSLVTYQDARPWARSIKNRVETRQMPPWHIDRSVGVQKFKNDMSLTDEQVATITAWVDGGALEGNPADFKLKPVATANFWAAERDGYGPPDLVIKAPEYTMPAVHQDEWWRPISDIPITEPRWVRMVEIRPSNVQARKILHHSIAYQILNPDNAAREHRLALCIPGQPLPAVVYGLVGGAVGCLHQPSSSNSTTRGRWSDMRAQASPLGTIMLRQASLRV